jgi:tRNA/rRNA methyltransferase
VPAVIEHLDKLAGVMGPRIVLVRTKESANVGAAARAMLNFGLTDLWLVAPRCRIDHRAFALASHAEDVLKKATIVADLGDALVGMNLVAGTSARPRRAENYVVRSPHEAAPELGSGSAVLFGPEDHGLSNEELTVCQLHVVIPTLDFSSLNLAQAVLVVAYEAAMAAERRAEAHPAATPAPNEGLAPATRDQVEGFYGQLEEAMLLIGYTDERRKSGIMRLFRGLFDRAAPTSHELAALRGLVSQTSWAARLEPDLLPGGRRGEPGPE